MISDRDIAPEFKFKCIFSALNTPSRVPSSSIIYERSQTSLWLIYKNWQLTRKQSRCFNKHYRWKGKVCMSDFGLTCPFNNEDLGWSALMCYSDFTTKDFIASVATSVMCHCQHLDHLSMLSLKRWAGTQQICHLEHTHVAHQHQSERVWSMTCMWEAATV